MTWKEGLECKGLYFEGVIDGSKLESTLELHRRETVSTFGTRRSSKPTHCSKNENVSILTKVVAVSHLIKQ